MKLIVTLLITLLITFAAQAAEWRRATEPECRHHTTELLDGLKQGESVGMIGTLTRSTPGGSIIAIQSCGLTDGVHFKPAYFIMLDQNTGCFTPQDAYDKINAGDEKLAAQLTKDCEHSDTNAKLSIRRDGWTEPEFKKRENVITDSTKQSI